MRREARIAERLPPDAPAPGCCTRSTTASGSRSCSRRSTGRLPRTPWDADELDRVLDATLGSASSYPSRRCGRSPSSTARCSPAGARSRPRTERSRRPMVSRPSRRPRRRRSRWEQVTVGDGLIHGDVRSDNVLLTADDGSCSSTGRARVSAPPGSRCGDAARRSSSRAAAPESVLARIGLDDLDVGSHPACRRRDRRLLRRARPAAGSAGPADPAPLPTGAGRSHERLAAPVVGPRLTVQSDQCRPIPNSQSPFSSGMSE